MPNVLSEPQIAGFRENGFVGPVRILSSQAMAERRARLDAFTRDQPEAAWVMFRSPHLLFTWLFDIVSRPTAVGVFKDLLGPNVLCSSSGFRIKPPGKGMYAGWHQDAYYVPYEPIWMTYLVAFTDHTLENGCIQVLPGSHREGLRPHADLDDERSVLSRGQRITVPIDESRAQPLEMKAGEAFVIHSALIHGSRPNHTQEGRIVYIVDIVPPAVTQPGELETAVLLSGSDTHGSFRLVPGPRRDLGPDEVERHRRAVSIRVKQSGQREIWPIPAELR